MKPLRYAVIGTSKIATQYITAAATTGQWALSAIYSRTQQSGNAFAAQHGNVPVFTNLDAFAQSDLFDAVYIASPNALHYAHCKLMLTHGKHVICEKPFTSYPWQLQELYLLAQQKQLVLLEAIMFMHQPARQALMQAIAAVGQVHMVQFENCRRSPQYDRLLTGETPNVFNPALHTGALMDMGVYCLYPALALFGRPAAFDAAATLLPVGTDACGTITLKYPDKIVVLRYAKTATSGLASEILGEQGRIVIGSILHTCDITLHAADATQTAIWGGYTKTDLMANEAADFARYILQGNKKAVQAEYLHCQETALLVCEYLEKIRKQIGLKF